MASHKVLAILLFSLILVCASRVDARGSLLQGLLGGASLRSNWQQHPRAASRLRTLPQQGLHQPFSTMMPVSPGSVLGRFQCNLC
jgi:hypothetical protein